MLDPNFIHYTTELPTFGVGLGGTTVRAVNGVLSLTEEQANELDALAVKRPDIASKIKKIDFEAADTLVRNYRAAKLAAASSGALNSQSAGGLSTLDKLRQMQAENKSQPRSAIVEPQKSTEPPVITPPGS